MIHLTRTPSQPSARGGAIPAAILVLLVVSLFVAAGFWQLQRARDKDAIRAKASAAMRAAPISLGAAVPPLADIEWRTLSARGEWRADKTIFLDNKVRAGVVGYQVVTPLRIAASDTHVLVNRGWIAASPLRGELPRLTTPLGMVEISGIARAPSQRYLELSRRNQEGDHGQVWQNLTIERFRSWSGLTLQPVVIHQQNAGAGALQREAVTMEASLMSAERHRGYALTWFGLAIATLLLAGAAKLKFAKNDAQT